MGRLSNQWISDPNEFVDNSTSGEAQGQVWLHFGADRSVRVPR